MNKIDKSISIIGCGWLGLPVGRHMLKSGWRACGSTTSEVKLQQLRDEGIEPFLLKLPEQSELNPSLFSTDCLLINIPSGRKNPNVLIDYPATIARIIAAAKQQKSMKQIVFISSTSIYGNMHGVINEQENPVPATDSGKAILAAENLIRKSEIPYMILRFGGLAGSRRHPGRFLAGKENLDNGDHPINYLHLEDAVGVVAEVMENFMENEVFNVVAPAHPTKQEFYTKMSTSIGLPSPTFNGGKVRGKEISVDLFLNKTGYIFKYPDPMYFEF